MSPNMVNYDDEYRNFKWQVPEFFNFGFDVIDKQAANGDKPALISVNSTGDSAEKHTFKDLSRLSNRFANVLRDRGVRKGDRVLVMTPQIAEWYFAVLGCIKLGAVFIPNPTLSTARDLEYRLNQSGAAAVVADISFAARFEAARAACPALKVMVLVGGERPGWTGFSQAMAAAPDSFKPDERGRSTDPLLIFFTSGTSGYPKMVLQNHSYAIAQETTARFFHDLSAGDVHWTLSDPGWAKTAYGKLFGQWAMGATIVQHNSPGRFLPEVTLKIIERYRVTSFCAPPTAFRMFVREDLSKYPLSTLRHCTSAGEPLTADTIKAWKDATGFTVYDGYGQSETVLLVANYPCLPVRPGSMGKPMPGHVIKLVDSEGNEVPPGVQGHLIVRVNPDRPPGLLREYWHSPETNAAAFQGDWYYTYDLAWRDADGYFWFVGRADDVIKSSGYRVGPFEVESTLQEHPAVAEAAVIGSRDSIRGEVVKAFVVLNPGYKPGTALAHELQEHVKHLTAPYKYPRKIEFVSDLPRNANGKVLRAELRRRERGEL